MVLKWSALPLLAAAFALAACRAPTPPAAKTDTRTLAVSGEGSVVAKPDLATISVGVTSEGETASLALAENNTRMEQVLKAAHTQGISDDDVGTSNLSMYPRYGNSSTAGEARHIVGYTVTNAVTMTVRDLGKLGSALDLFVSAAGANTIDGLSFGFADPAALSDDARRKAFDNARHKAELYAAAAGVKLGAVREISEQATNMPVPYPRMAMTTIKGVPVAAGTSKVSATVRVVFALE